MIPYEPALITRLLRGMGADRLAAVAPSTFQTWPAQKITKTAAIAEMIANERAKRRAAA